MERLNGCGIHVGCESYRVDSRRDQVNSGGLQRHCKRDQLLSRRLQVVSERYRHECTALPPRVNGGTTSSRYGSIFPRCGDKQGESAYT
jgi:hypothetical protein